MIRALVVDDEIIIAEDLAYQLNAKSDWQVQVCTNPSLVADMLDSNCFDVCFLDIEMPEQNGISLARCIREKHPDIIIIFVTAFAEHAATAFRLPATDYIVKPVNSVVLTEACERVEKLVAPEFVDDDKVSKPKNGVIVVKSVGRTDYVKISDILMGQAAGNYVRLYCKDKEYLHRCVFSELADQMTSKGFVRCHRSYIVNADHVTAFVKNKDAGDELVLNSTIKAPVSQGYKKSINKMLTLAGANL